MTHSPFVLVLTYALLCLACYAAAEALSSSPEAHDDE